MAAVEKIPNNAEFRALWEGGELTVKQIATHFGVNHQSSVSKAARRYGFPPRRPGNGLVGAGRVYRAPERDLEAEAAMEAEQAREEETRAETIVDRLMDRGITPKSAINLAVGLVRAGCYADLDALAKRHGQPLTRLMPLWHEVRT